MSSINAAWGWEEAHTFVVAQGRGSHARPAGDFPNDQFFHVLSSFSLLTSSALEIVHLWQEEMQSHRRFHR